jgi:hypothetical protein
MSQAELDQLRSARARTVDLVQGLTQPQIDFSPGSGQWCVGEQLDHLILSEKITRGDIAELINLTKAGRKPELYRSFADFDVTLFFLPKSLLPLVEVPFNCLGMFIPDSVREFLLRYTVIPSRNAAAATPRKGRRADELLQDLRVSLRETETLFEANPNLDYAKMIHRHPLLGTHTVPQLLNILSLHEQRHQDQISNLLAHPSFPKTS